MGRIELCVKKFFLNCLRIFSRYRNERADNFKDLQLIDGQESSIVKPICEKRIAARSQECDLSALGFTHTV